MTDRDNRPAIPLTDSAGAARWVCEELSGYPMAGSCRPLLSLIIPAYNERDRIITTLETVTDFLEQGEIDYEVIVVSDGSTDGTDELASQFARTHPRVRLVAYRPNRGKGFAVRTGVATSRGRYVAFIDADLAVPISVVGAFLEALQDGYDIVVASRHHPESTVAAPPPWKRRVMSQVFAWLVRRLVIDAFPDTQCGAKGFRADIARKLFARQQIDHFSFDAEILFLALREGYAIKEIPITLYYTPTTSIRPIRDALLMLRDLFRIRLNAWRGRYDRAASE
ncbi:MAG: glycosyltransferase family 2 protein [Thermomicrobium sp.]|nr:glycosyltransferase family 2 protein [Thermomicrobium sp.]MDW8005816.1 glycosyltransferase family 2 protein [Thermomicrobium sp.]